MAKFLGRAQGSAKVRNHPKSQAARAELRIRALAELDADAHVLDLFAGEGVMHGLVYRDQATSYVACDETWWVDDRLAFVCDNRRLLRTLDLTPFNFFDLDAFGSAWEQAYIISERRRVQPGERIGFALTDGARFSFNRSSMPSALARFAGLQKAPPMSMYKETLLWALAGFAKAMRCDITWMQQASGKTGMNVQYFAWVMQGHP